MVKILFPRISATLCCLLVGLLVFSTSVGAQSQAKVPGQADSPTAQTKTNKSPINPAQRVAVAKSTAAVFQQVDLFDTKNKSTAAAYDQAVTNGVVFDLNTDKVASFLQTNPDQFTMTLPAVYGKKDFKLELVRSNVISSGFQVYTSGKPGQPLNYTPGLHYHGIVQGDENSLVAISVFDNQVMGLIANNDGNYTIGKLENSDRGHIIYLGSDLKQLNEFICETEDDGFQYRDGDLEYTAEKDAGDCVGVYIEVDRSLTIGAGGAVQATNMVTGVFNQSAILYANEGISTNISEIFVWTTPDPYSGPSASQYRAQFQANTGAFNGDLGHLVALHNVGGQAAGFSGLCNANTDESLCFSGFSSLNFNNVPTYSFNVQIFTHELGHLYGSRHTHACVWNGNSTAIDGCAGYTEGPCALPPSANPGTIMSYCNPNINFNEGFHPQPSAVINNRVNNASCLSPCGATNNDLCSGAIELECGTPVFGSTIGYGASDAPTSCSASVYPSEGAWFTITVPTDQIVTISTDNPGTDNLFDTGLTVYTSANGCGGPYTCVTVNDDADGLQSTVMFTATANVTYYIYLDGFLNDTGDYELSVECEEPCQAPTAVCQNTTVQLDANGNRSITVAAVDGGSTAECGLLSLAASPFSFNCSDVGANMVTLTVTDINNDSDNCTATVTVEDNIPPVITLCQGNPVDFNGEDRFLSEDYIDFDATDACGIASISYNPVYIYCDELGETVPVTVTVTDVNGNSNDCVANVLVTGLPCGWMDFGDDGIGCEDSNDASYDVPSETFTLVSEGCYSNNWAADDAAYVKYELCGDGEIIAHVTAFNPIAGGWAGISARETEAPGAKKVALATNLGSLLRREIRTTTNGYSIPQQFFSPGKTWLKLVRNGSMFIGYASIDGNTWQMVMYANVAMTDCIQFGLYATNTNGGVFTASFDNVEVFEAGALRLPETGTGIVDAQSLDAADFSVFPNPAKERIEVDLSNYYGLQAQVEILNQLGQPVQLRQLKEVGSSPEQFDVNDLNNGTYFIRVTTDKGDKVKRFIIVK